MKKKLKFVHDLGLETYNEREDYFCIYGINGQASTIYNNDSSWKLKVIKHLKDMGRDEFKVKLNRMLKL